MGIGESMADDMSARCCLLCASRWPLHPLDDRPLWRLHIYVGFVCSADGMSLVCSADQNDRAAVQLLSFVCFTICFGLQSRLPRGRSAVQSMQPILGMLFLNSVSLQSKLSPCRSAVQSRLAIMAKTYSCGLRLQCR